MTQHQTIRFSIHISYAQYLKVYQGIAKTITVVSDDGKSVVFPAGNIQSFLTRQGINGHFEMELTPLHKFVGIKKIR